MRWLTKDKKGSLFVSVHKFLVKSWDVRVIVVTPLKGQDKPLSILSNFCYAQRAFSNVCMSKVSLLDFPYLHCNSRYFWKMLVFLLPICSHSPMVSRTMETGPSHPRRITEAVTLPWLPWQWVEPTQSLRREFRRLGPSPRSTKPLLRWIQRVVHWGLPLTAPFRFKVRREFCSSLIAFLWSWPVRET